MKDDMYERNDYKVSISIVLRVKAVHVFHHYWNLFCSSIFLKGEPAYPLLTIMSAMFLHLKFYFNYLHLYYWLLDMY